METGRRQASDDRGAVLEGDELKRKRGEGKKKKKRELFTRTRRTLSLSFTEIFQSLEVLQNCFQGGILLQALRFLEIFQKGPVFLKTVNVALNQTISYRKLDKIIMMMMINRNKEREREKW